MAVWAQHCMAHNRAWLRGSLGLLSLTGLCFLITQYYAWGELVTAHVYVVGHPSGSFVYIMSGAHALHIISALCFVGRVFFQALRSGSGVRDKNNLNMCATYWHFLGVIWLYLHIFFLVTN